MNNLKKSAIFDRKLSKIPFIPANKQNLAAFADNDA